MRGSEELRQTDNPTIYKRLMEKVLHKENGRACLCCPPTRHRKQDLKSWKTNRMMQYHVVMY